MRSFGVDSSGPDSAALFLRDRTEDGRLVALTGNYMEALMDGDDSWMNRFVRMTLDERRGRTGAGR